MFCSVEFRKEATYETAGAFSLGWLSRKAGTAAITSNSGLSRRPTAIDIVCRAGHEACLG